MIENQETNQRIRTRQAAQYLGEGVSYKMLEKMRVIGGGPVYMKFGRNVIYDTSDLDAWLASKRRASTTVALPADQMAGA